MSWIGLLLVVIGGIGMAAAFHLVPTRVFSLWPLILVGLGVLGLARRPAWLVDLDLSLGPELAQVLGLPRRMLSWSLIVLGLLILPFSLHIQAIAGPVALVALGAYLIWRRVR